MTNTIYVRPVYEDESLVESSEYSFQGSEAVANSIETKRKRGLCYRCLKGNRFTEKEACIVCNAKYCSRCVLGAMGLMPEGRKCVNCVGLPIDESKRTELGECSRLLKRLFSELVIRRIMNMEKFCEANQLCAGLVYVNGQQLCQDELVLLKSCPNPPTELKAACYWYDKLTGLWGKEGQKPSKIISSGLDVGGFLMKNASSGNTQVYINNREITKVELLVLQLAGVQCARESHFWVDQNGSYMEEGQNNIKGNLWSKVGVKLVCNVLSLPLPYRAAFPSRVKFRNSVSRAVPDYKMAMPKKFEYVSTSSSATEDFPWSKILAAKNIAPKLTMFCWKVLKGDLRTRAGLGNHIKPIYLLCHFCHECTEDLDHLLVNCTFAQAVLFASYLNFRRREFTTVRSVIKTWINDSDNGLSYKIGLSIFWGIWKCRNALIFNGTVPLVQSALHMSRSIFMQGSPSCC